MKEIEVKNRTIRLFRTTRCCPGSLWVAHGDERYHEIVKARVDELCDNLSAYEIPYLRYFNIDSKGYILIFPWIEADLIFSNTSYGSENGSFETTGFPWDSYNYNHGGDSVTVLDMHQAVGCISLLYKMSDWNGQHVSDIMSEYLSRYLKFPKECGKYDVVFHNADELWDSFLHGDWNIADKEWRYYKP